MLYEVITKQFKLKNYIICMVLAIVSTSAFAVDIWVSPKGNDTNPGTEAQPMQSIQQALLKARELRSGNDSSAQDGIQIILKAGEYQLQAPILLEPEDSNTTICAAKDAKVIISGGQHVTGWQQVGKYIYKAHLDRDSKLRTLFVNGKRMHMAGTDVPVNGLGDWGKFEIKGDEPWARNNFV